MKSFTYFGGLKAALIVNLPILILDAVLAWLYYFHILLVGWVCVFLLLSLVLRSLLTRIIKNFNTFYSTGTYKIENGVLTIQTRNEIEIPLNTITKIYAERQKRSGQQEYILKFLKGKRIVYQIVSAPVKASETFSNTDLYNLCIDTVNACDSIDTENSNEKIYMWLLNTNS